MKPQIAKIQNMCRNFSVLPESVNQEDRTIELVWTTGARATQWNWDIGEYIEELSVTKEAINLERLNSGNAPFLNMHNGWELSAILGVVEKAWIDEEKCEGRAVVRFPKNDEEVDKVWNLISQGIIRNISVGYSVEQYEKYEENGKFIYRAVKWTPLELSAVTIPADAKATVRSAEVRTSDCIISTRCTTKENIMKRSDLEEDKNKGVDQEDENRTDDETDPENDTPTEEDEQNRENCETEDDKDDKEDEVSRSRKAKNVASRRDYIYDLCEAAGLSIKEARSYEQSDMSLKKVRSEILEKRASKSADISNNRGVSLKSTNQTLAQRTAAKFKKGN